MTCLRWLIMLQANVHAPADESLLLYMIDLSERLIESLAKDTGIDECSKYRCPTHVAVLLSFPADPRRTTACSPTSAASLQRCRARHGAPSRYTTY